MFGLGPYENMGALKIVIHDSGFTFGLLFITALTFA